MEEKRKETGTPPAAISGAAASATTSTPLNLSEFPAAEPPSLRRRGGQKRKASNISSGNTSTPPSTSSKRQTREKPSAVPFAPIHNGPCTRARQQPNNAASSPSASAVAMKSEVEAVMRLDGGRGEVMKADEELNAAKEDWEALEAKIEAEYEAIRSRDDNAHVVPIFSGWFSWNKVHPLEERSLPSFFSGKSENRTPEIYIDIRNWILKKFHENPSTQIELKDLSELLVGEMDARQEVMEFLDYWGLINYHPFPQADSAVVSADIDETIDTNSLVEKLYHFETEQSCAMVIPRTNVATPAAPKLFPESAIAEELVRPEGPSVEYHCNSCSADCSRKRYHCQKQADFDLCTECFNNGKFGSDMYPSDFILMEPAEASGLSGGKWTDQETLLLLEALELYKENWNEIAEHVATKTKAQCILHFVQMPIEDMFLDCDDEIVASLKENVDPVSTNDDTSAPKDASESTETKDAVSDNQPLLSSPMEISKAEHADEPIVGRDIGENCALKALKEAFEAVGSLPLPAEQFSFADAGNPVMALAAFLMQLVEPNVVTASARSSLKSISGNPSGVQLAARHCFLLEDPPYEKEKSADIKHDICRPVESVDQETEKDVNKRKEKQKEEKLVSVFDGSGLTNDHHIEENRDSVTEEKGTFVSSNAKCAEKLCATKEPEVTKSHKEAELAQLNVCENPDLPKVQEPNTAEKLDDLMSKVELLPSSSKESQNGASAAGPSQSTESPEDEDMINESLPSENKEPEQPLASSSMVENGANKGEEEVKDCNNGNNSKNDFDFNKLKRAAVTALSAAAVKAKFLASQEEDQIRLLATSLIEKQLHKLDTKLTFFTEMENVVMRVREQLERSKQRLFHERAQIIAARLGIAASSSRPMAQSLPINRAAMAFVNSAPRPPMGMTSQRPPISRPVMALTPSNPLVPATVAGSSLQASNQDKLSSVKMK